MSNNSKVPQIRFKGFTEDWEQLKLLQILVQRIEHQKITEDAPLLAFSYAEGVINPEDKKSNKRDFIMTDKYNKIFSRTEKDDIIYNPANVIHGAIHRNKLGTGVVSPIYKIFKCEKTSSKFVGERLHTDKFIEEIKKYIEGTVIKLRTLSPEQFLDMRIEIPSTFDEQERIGTYFQYLDNLITLHQRKYDKLVNIKKALLERMFPQEGETAPAIRFKGFTDAWEQYKLSDLFEKGGSGGTPLSTNPDYYNGNIPFLGISDITNSNGLILETEKYITVKGLDNSAAWIVPSGSISLAMYASVGKLAILGVNAATSQAFYNMVFNSDSVRDFVYHRLYKANSDSEWDKLISTGTQSNLNAEKVKEFEISIPNNDLEISKIGSLFRTLDNLITLHQRKLEKLKNIKSALLEKMFVS